MDRKKSQKRLAALVLIASAAFAATGCGSGDGGGEDKATPAPEAAPSELDGSTAGRSRRRRTCQQVGE